MDFLHPTELNEFQTLVIRAKSTAFGQAFKTMYTLDIYPSNACKLPLTESFFDIK